MVEKDSPHEKMLPSDHITVRYLVSTMTRSSFYYIILCSCLLFLLLSTTTLAAQSASRESNNEATAQIPATLLASALNHAVAHMDENLVNQLYSDNNINALYKVAKSMYANISNNNDNVMNAVQIFHALAEEHHVPSMIQLGFAYSEHDKPQAIKYFVQAGEGGPDAASLYNAGRLLAEEGNYAPALGYIRAAAGTGNDMSKTATAKEGYQTLSQQLQTIDLSLQDMVDVFPYADLEDEFPQNEAEKLWNTAMEKLSRGKDLEFVVKKLSELQVGHHQQMSSLQTNLLRRILVILLGKMNSEL